MKTVQPDIVVISPDGDYLMLVEVKLNDKSIHNQNAITQLIQLMASIGCSVGLVVSGERIILLIYEHINDLFDLSLSAHQRGNSGKNL